MKRKIIHTILAVIFIPLVAWSDSANKDRPRPLETTKYMLLMHQKHMNELSPSELSSPSEVADIGNIAVIKGNKKTLFRRNLFDLTGRKISFSPNNSGGYDVKVTSETIAAAAGTNLGPAPIHSKKVNFDPGFSFPFYGVSYTSVTVEGSGCLSFGGLCSYSNSFPDLSGAPMIMPLDFYYAEEVWVLETQEKVTITWKTPSAYRTDTQVNLLKNGTIEFLYGDRSGDDGFTGISPGNTTTSNLKLVNFSKGSTIQGGAKTAFFEQFRPVEIIDTVQLLQEFHQTHPQIYDFVAIFTNQPYETNDYYSPPSFVHIQNSIRGIGLSEFDDSASFGSSQIQGVILMNSLAELPSDPNLPFQGTYNTLQLMGLLIGRRWLPYPQVLIGGKKTNDLLGYVTGFDPREQFFTGSWNFFMDTDASVMGGNDINDNGNGSFITTASTLGYSKLDQYLMGLIPSSAVPRFFFVRTASNNCNPFDIRDCTGREPQVGVSFSGKRVNVRVKKIIRAEGRRDPSSDASQKEFRVAFLYFLSSGTNPNSSEIAQIDTIRTEFEIFFRSATDGHGTVETKLR